MAISCSLLDDDESVVLFLRSARRGAVCRPVHDVPQAEQVHLRTRDRLHDSRTTEAVDLRDRERRGRR